MDVSILRSLVLRLRGPAARRPGLALVVCGMVAAVAVGATTGQGPTARDTGHPPRDVGGNTALRSGPSASVGTAADSADFVGAEVCGSCHQEQYAAWKGSTHGEAGGAPSPETVIAPFDGTPIRFADATVVPAVDAGGRYSFTVRRDGREELRLEVAGVIGKGHMLGGGTQGFVTSWPDGTDRFVPFDFSATLGRWFCNTGYIAGWWVPGGGHVDLRPDTGWVPVTSEMKLTDCGDWPPIRVMGTDRRYANCQQCHGSQIALVFDTVAHRYRTRWTSLRVNCESCHGPGRAHVERARAGTLEAGAPTSIPERRGGAPPGVGRTRGIGYGRAILDPGSLARDASLGICFQCHAVKRHMEGAYLPGDTLAAHYSLGLPLLGRDRPLLPDGKVRTFAYQGDHLYSACWYGGGMTCVDCHDPHGQGYRDIDGAPLSGPYDDGQCLDCHASKAADPTAHTHHGADSPGSRCVVCHMPYRQQPGVGPHVPYGRSDHTISIPRPGVDEEEGVPSACALCHDDAATRELATTVRTWYGALAPRPRLVEAVAAARGGGDSLPDGLRAAALVDPDEAARMPTAQVAALNELFLGYVRPDLGRERVQAQDTALVARLRVLAGGDGFAPDVAGVSLALLHLGWGDVPAVRAFLDRRRGELGADPGRVTLRWARALQLMGDAWRAGGRMAWALRAFTRAQEARPTDPSILLDLASTYTSLGRAEESLPYYVQAIRRDPTQSVALVNLGLTLESLGRDGQAEGAYRRAVEVDPSEALAHMNLGNMALRRGEAAAAASSYEAALLHDPSLSRAAFYLAVARVRLNDLRGARSALLAAQEFAPDDEEVTTLLRRVEEALAGGSGSGASGR